MPGAVKALPFNEISGSACLFVCLFVGRFGRRDAFHCISPLIQFVFVLDAVKALLALMRDLAMVVGSVGGRLPRTIKIISS